MSSFYNSVKIPPSAAGKKLSDYLASVGVMVQADCGAKGTCGKCRVKVLSGFFYSDSAFSQKLIPDDDGNILSCKAFCSEKEAVVQVDSLQGEGLTNFLIKVEQTSHKTDYYAAVLDIGTTTLACGLIHVSSQGIKVIKTTSKHNPQKSFGADVLSRISSAVSGNLLLMQTLLFETISQMICELTRDLASDIRLQQMVVVGNTTMLHIFCGVSPEKIGVYPFVPEFTDMKIFKGDALGLPADDIILLPSVSAFIGSDIVSGILLTELIEENQAAALIDIGTNGEMVLFTGKNNSGKLFATSAAAGPALEGAGISSGVGGIKGAVCRVDFVGARPVCKVIDNAPALGICGSGLIDLTAGLCTLNVIDDTGYMEVGDFTYAFTENGSKLMITQQDIRALQLAKSAIRAGFEALCRKADISLCDIGKVYIAGGLGFYMNIDSALAIGLFDPALRGKFINIGNSALGGAIKFLDNPKAIEHVNNVATFCKTIDLTRSEEFNRKFVEYMNFN